MKKIIIPSLLCSLLFANELDILQKDFRKLPFEVLAISEDFKGIAVAEDHFNKYGIRHLKLYHDYKNSLFKAMGVVGLPTAFLI